MFVLSVVSFFPGPATPMPLGKLYTLGIRSFVSRAHAVSLLPEVMPLIESGRLFPGEVTPHVVGWDDAPEAYLEDTIKLVVARDFPRPGLSVPSRLPDRGSAGAA